MVALSTVVASQSTRRGLAAQGMAILLARRLSLAAENSPLLSEFQKTEQSLMDAIAPANKNVWEQVMDEGCIITSEEGQISTRERFLKDLAPLPPGLSGHITVRDLTLQEFPSFAVVRYLADEWELVFGQRLTTQYRATDTFRKTVDGWKMVSSHFSVVTRDPPAQEVNSTSWPGLAGTYQLIPDGWTFHVTLNDGRLFGGRDPNRLQLFVPLTSDSFVLSGTLGVWIFVCAEEKRPARLVDYRKFEPLVWTRVA